MNSAIISDLIIEVFIWMAAVTSPLSLPNDRTCHVIDTLVIIDYWGWYCYRFFLLCKNFCNLWYTWCRPVLTHCQSLPSTPCRHELMRAHTVANANSASANMIKALMNPII